MEGPLLMDTNEKVILTDRERLMEVVYSRLDHVEDVGFEDISMKMLASLITDDILSSPWKGDRDTTMYLRGVEAGYEKGLRESIAAIGNVERMDEYEGVAEPRLILYNEAQKEVARLSTKGLEALWNEEQEEANV